MKVEFLQARLEVAEKEWEKANKKWMNSKHCAEALDANSKVKNSMTKMAFLNGQRKLLKELISLETSTSSKIKMQADSNSQPHRVAGSPEEATSESERIGSRQTASQCVEESKGERHE